MRDLQQADLPAVLAIETSSFDAPWSQAMFLSELSRPDSVCLAAMLDGELIGYLVCTRHARVWHLNNIAVAAGRRRRGIGTLLLEEMLERIGTESELTLEVRPTNRAAIELYAEHGFRPAGRRRAYYPDNREDALIMTRPAERRDDSPGAPDAPIS